MDHIITVLCEIHEQLGVTASFDIQVKEGEVEISIRWLDEGGNKFRLSQLISQKNMKTKPLMEIFTPLCDEIRDLLGAVRSEKSENFYRDLMSGKIPTEFCET